MGGEVAIDVIDLPAAGLSRSCCAGTLHLTFGPATVVPVTFALNPKEALTVTYAESFAAEVRLALLRPGEESELNKKERVYRRPSQNQSQGQ